MNKILIIGNLCNNPTMKATKSGADVCEFDVAVNGRKNANGDQETTYFRVSAWRGLAASCAAYLAKGRKVAVIGSIRGRAYADKNGTPRASLEITADEVEFLSPRQDAGESSYVQQERQAIQQETQQSTMFPQYTPVEPSEDLPF